MVKLEEEKTIMTTRKQNRSYTPEFKQQMVNLYNSGKSALEIAKEYDISDKSLYKWIHQHKNSGTFKAIDNRTPEEKELIELRKRNKQLEMENDILKQAALIMGRKL